MGKHASRAKTPGTAKKPVGHEEPLEDVARRLADALAGEPEGLEKSERDEVIAALFDGTVRALGEKGARYRTLQQRFDEEGHAGAPISRREGSVTWISEVALELLHEGIRLGLHSPDGYGEPTGHEFEAKAAIRVALTSLGAASPRTLASAMGTALSTLYSYSDVTRENRPGPQRLFRAAFAFERLALQFSQTADYLRKVARAAPAAREEQHDKGKAGVERQETATSQQSSKRLTASTQMSAGVRAAHGNKRSRS